MYILAKGRHNGNAFVYNERMKQFIFLSLLLVSCSTVTESSSSSLSSSLPPIDYSYLQTYDSSFDVEQLSYETITSPRDDFIRGVDVSTFEEVILQGGVFYNEFGDEEHLFSILKRAGINLIRVRLWVNPREFHPWNGGYLDLETVTRLAHIAQAYDMQWLLDYHYSDTWADPGNQIKPDAWNDLSFDDLVDQVYTYTRETMQHFIQQGVEPDFVQIGNEINNGMLWDDGKIYQNNQTNFAPLIRLLKAGVQAVRETSPSARIILHLASGDDANQFYQFFLNMLVAGVDFDIIAASFYSYWNGTLDAVAANFYQLALQFEKDILLVETSQAYTLKPNPWGINIYGPDQNALSHYPATIAGQASLVYDALKMMTEIPNAKGLGVVYWEPAWIPIANNQGFTSWANQTFFTYEGRVVPSLFTFNAVK